MDRILDEIIYRISDIKKEGRQPTAIMLGYDEWHKLVTEQSALQYLTYNMHKIVRFDGILLIRVSEINFLCVTSEKVFYKET